MDEKKTILLVDDDIDFLTQIKMQLLAAGYNVISAECEEEAENILKTTKPDMMISDLMMEHYDGGFGLSNKVKKIDPAIPVILVTSVTNEVGLKFNASNEEERSWLKADSLLNKPIRFEQLVKEIHKFLK